MSDIKKKFLDILFEQESEEIEAESPLTDIKEKPVVKEIKKAEPTKAPNAKDILYGKQDRPSSFIDYYEVPKKEKPEVVVDDTYEMRDNVSPIFGPIALKEKKKKQVNDKEIQKAITNTTNEYVGIVISPIYGYDAGKANDARKSLGDKNKKEYNDTGYYPEEAFEVPEDMKETIKEAIQEAVVELTPSTNNNFVEKNKETVEVVDNNEEISIENEEVEEETIEDVSFDDYIPDETYNIEDEVDPMINEELYEETPQEESVDDFIMEAEQVIVEEDIEDIKQDEKEEEIIEDISFDDVKEEAAEIDNVEETNELETIDLAPKATRSIYDTTPVQLFDFDELTEKDSNENDLFDELIGDDD